MSNRKIIIKPTPSPKPATRSNTRLNHTSLLTPAEIQLIPVSPIQPVDPPAISATVTPAKRPTTSRVALTTMTASSSILPYDTTRPTITISTLQEDVSTSDDDNEPEDTGAYRRNEAADALEDRQEPTPPVPEQSSYGPANSPEAGGLDWAEEDAAPQRLYSNEELARIANSRSAERLGRRGVRQEKLDTVSKFIKENYPPKFTDEDMKILNEQPDLKADRVAEIIEVLTSDDDYFKTEADILDIISNCKNCREIERMCIIRHKENIQQTGSESVRVNETKRCWRRRTQEIEANLRIDRFYMRLKCMKDDEYFEKVKKGDQEVELKERKEAARLRKQRNKNKRRNAKAKAREGQKSGRKSSSSPRTTDARKFIQNPKSSDARHKISPKNCDARKTIVTRSRSTVDVDARNKIDSRDRVERQASRSRYDYEDRNYGHRDGHVSKSRYDYDGDYYGHREAPRSRRNDRDWDRMLDQDRIRQNYEEDRRRNRIRYGY